METELNSLHTVDLTKFAADLFNCIPTLCPYHKVCVIKVLIYEAYNMQKLIFSIFQLKSDSWNLISALLLWRLFILKSKFLFLFVVRVVAIMR